MHDGVLPSSENLCGAAQPVTERLSPDLSDQGVGFATSVGFEEERRIARLFASDDEEEGNSSDSLSEMENGVEDQTEVSVFCVGLCLSGAVLDSH